MLVGFCPSTVLYPTNINVVWNPSYIWVGKRCPVYSCWTECRCSWVLLASCWAVWETLCRNAAFWYPQHSKNPVWVPHLFFSFLFHFQGGATLHQALALRARRLEVVTLVITQRSTWNPSTPKFWILVGSSWMIKEQPPKESSGSWISEGSLEASVIFVWYGSICWRLDQGSGGVQLSLGGSCFLCISVVASVI